jgi:glucan phosphoethanolaminetransferase (alkaline phosphatase superfamily)
MQCIRRWRAVCASGFCPAWRGVFLIAFFQSRISRVNHGVSMNVTLSLGPLVSLIAGILILVMPRLLNYIVALYLIIIGIIGIFGVGSSHL